MLGLACLEIALLSNLPLTVSLDDYWLTYLSFSPRGVTLVQTKILIQVNDSIKGLAFSLAINMGDINECFIQL